jgi:hypothetical protein
MNNYSGHIGYDAVRPRIEDLHRQAAAGRLAQKSALRRRRVGAEAGLRAGATRGGWRRQDGRYRPDRRPPALAGDESRVEGMSNHMTLDASRRKGSRDDEFG